MENTKRIGNLTELACITRLYEIGCSVSIPFGNSEKYDVIIDWKDKLYKIQIKHAQEHINEEGFIDYISIRCEWQGHNTAHFFGLKQHRTTDVDLNNKDEDSYRLSYYLLPSGK